MAEALTSQEPNGATDAIKPIILQQVQSILELQNVAKIYFIDDAIKQDTGKATFLGIVEGVISAGKREELKQIQLTGINFNTDDAVLSDHINETWDTLRPSKQLRYYEKVYTIAGNPEAIKDLNVSNNLSEFFKEAQIVFLTPNEWDTDSTTILASIPEGQKIIVLFDQDLRLASGRFSSGAIQGENLILELKQKNLGHKVIVGLLTHTVTQYEEELPKRVEICDKINDLQPGDFFVMAKIRLEKPVLFADGLKKTCLNTYCEEVKEKTIGILSEGQKRAIDKLKKLDTYDFDHTVFKSSFTEGVWEPETLLRISDVIFKDEVRQLMVDNNYVQEMNDQICKAREISNVEFEIEDPGNPYKERFKLRNQEIYEPGILINPLRKPIENGDIFKITEGENKDKVFILVAQECDLMVRAKDDDAGKRSVRSATLLEIEILTEKQLVADITKKYQKEIDKKSFQNHFFSDKFKLEYFESGTNKVGIVRFTKSITIDLNVLDLIVFDQNGEARLDINTPSYNDAFHSASWKARYALINEEFKKEAAILETLYAQIESIPDEAAKAHIRAKINYLFSFIQKAGIPVSYTSNLFRFGINRISRLRLPKSKYLLDRYFQHQSRFADAHDFASS